jgi:hypothetical protein
MAQQDQDFIMAQMDEAANLAKQEFKKLLNQPYPAGGTNPNDIVRWYAKYKNTAGYKRLGQIIVDYAKTLPS